MHSPACDGTEATSAWAPVRAHTHATTVRLACLLQNNKDYFDQGLDEVKLLQYVNAADPHDEAGILRLHDFFYFKVRAQGPLGRRWLPARCGQAARCCARRACTPMMATGCP